jgi:hypothetical protein
MSTKTIKFNISKHNNSLFYKEEDDCEQIKKDEYVYAEQYCKTIYIIKKHTRNGCDVDNSNYINKVITKTYGCSQEYERNQYQIIPKGSKVRVTIKQ